MFRVKKKNVRNPIVPRSYSAANQNLEYTDNVVFEWYPQVWINSLSNDSDSTRLSVNTRALQFSVGFFCLFFFVLFFLLFSYDLWGDKKNFISFIIRFPFIRFPYRSCILFLKSIFCRWLNISSLSFSGIWTLCIVFILLTTFRQC